MQLKFTAVLCAALLSGTVTIRAAPIVTTLDRPDDRADGLLLGRNEGFTDTVFTTLDQRDNLVEKAARFIHSLFDRDEDYTDTRWQNFKARDEIDESNPNDTGFTTLGERDSLGGILNHFRHGVQAASGVPIRREN